MKRAARSRPCIYWPPPSDAAAFEISPGVMSGGRFDKPLRIGLRSRGGCLTNVGFLQNLASLRRKLFLVHNKIKKYKLVYKVHFSKKREKILRFYNSCLFPVFKY